MNCSGDIAAAIENAVDRHALGFDMKGNRNTPLETDRPQPGTYIVAPHAAFSEHVEAEAIFFQPSDVGNSALGTRMIGYIVVETDQIGDRFRREGDLTLSHGAASCAARRGAP